MTRGMLRRQPACRSSAVSHTRRGRGPPVLATGCGESEWALLRRSNVDTIVAEMTESSEYGGVTEVDPAWLRGRRRPQRTELDQLRGAADRKSGAQVASHREHR